MTPLKTKLQTALACPVPLLCLEGQLSRIAVLARAPADLRLGKQQRTHLQLRFVQLRFRVADRAVQQLRNLVMLVPFHFVQGEDGPASFWTLLQCATQRNAVHHTREFGIRSSKTTMQRG